MNSWNLSYAGEGLLSLSHDRNRIWILQKDEISFRWSKIVVITRQCNLQLHIYEFCAIILSWKSIYVYSASWIVFAGGMPKANFQDKNTVSITHGDTNVALDFSSPIVDFLILSQDDCKSWGFCCFNFYVIEWFSHSLISVDRGTDTGPESQEQEKGIMNWMAVALHFVGLLKVLGIKVSTGRCFW
jgi:LLGL2